MTAGNGEGREGQAVYVKCEPGEGGANQYAGPGAGLVPRDQFTAELVFERAFFSAEVQKQILPCAKSYSRPSAWYSFCCLKYSSTLKYRVPVSHRTVTTF